MLHSAIRVSPILACDPCGAWSDAVGLDFVEVYAKYVPSKKKIFLPNNQSPDHGDLDCNGWDDGYWGPATFPSYFGNCPN